MDRRSFFFVRSEIAQQRSKYSRLLGMYSSCSAPRMLPQRAINRLLLSYARLATIQRKKRPGCYVQWEMCRGGLDRQISRWKATTRLLFFFVAMQPRKI